MTDPTDFLEIARQIDAFIKPEAEGRQARTRERILRAATDLFVAYGYRKTSIEDIAGAARVAKGTVYLYYDNKAELLLHAIALQKLVADHGVQVRKLPESVLVAMGNAAGQVMAELRENSDELVKRIVESFLAYRSSVAPYMVYADNGQMNARALEYKY